MITIDINGDENQRPTKVRLALALRAALLQLGFDCTSDEDPLLVDSASKSFDELRVEATKTGATGAPAVGVLVRSRKPVGPPAKASPKKKAKARR